MALDPELLQLYRATHFEVRLPSQATRACLRIGQPLPAAVQAWLADAPLCAFITAYNPYSQTQAAALNRAAQQTLLQQLKHLQARWLPAVGRIPGQTWREPSLLVADIALDAVDALAWRHSQNAVVVAHRPANAQLRIYTGPVASEC